MAITYPRSLPACGARRVALELFDPVVSAASKRGLVINRTQVVDPLWRLRAETHMLRQPAEWIAWGASLGGGLRTFLASDSRYRQPLAYPNAGVPGDVAAGWDGTADVTALGSGGALSLALLPSSYQITAGDRIGLEQGSPLRRGYYMALEDVTASAGGVATVTVTPFLHTAIFTAAATARLWRPSAEFVLDPSTWPENPGALPRWSSFSFEAWQTI
ncbi:hypothetical protein Snov_0025 [Ancylobacter novellus DSM 506]|uniref:Uncharacterized protein n=1 Tax=Ancylobacter novellus (strain ATCC 8093 / DSM 506 / JCM 20403 / CCM 1077 / IAM 12100 / NBRC 12443 / NCIMB 10456) TaxID=639283 RepID=D6ZZU8_ANCN5|nr:hypothetical protein [Ancylobacter novellus]ADH87362.1 hypothetical protein Snov_0025 [Ancylobacter novellus DSM 506]